MAIECIEKTNEAEVMNFLQSVGAADITVQYKETGWWLCTYDKDVKPFENKEQQAIA
jgi:hypothetical protein